MDFLKGGYKLSDAIAAASHLVGPPDGFDDTANAITLNTPDGIPMFGQAAPVIYGDPNMTFFSRVYGGAFAGQWYTGEQQVQPG